MQFAHLVRFGADKPVSIDTGCHDVKASAGCISCTLVPLSDVQQKEKRRFQLTLVLWNAFQSARRAYKGVAVVTVDGAVVFIAIHVGSVALDEKAQIPCVFVFRAQVVDDVSAIRRLVNADWTTIHYHYD